MSVSKSSDEPRAFEDVYSRLEETVRSLEEGGLSLAEATELFQEGMRLAMECNELLSSAELRISQLQSDYDVNFNQLHDVEQGEETEN